MGKNSFKIFNFIFFFIEIYKEKEKELANLNVNSRTMLSQSLKSSLNNLIKDFEANLEGKYHRLEDELVEKQLIIEELRGLVGESACREFDRKRGEIF